MYTTDVIEYEDLKSIFTNQPRKSTIYIILKVYKMKSEKVQYKDVKFSLEHFIKQKAESKS